MEGVRRRAEFIAGVPLLAAQYAAQRATDAIKDASELLVRERRNARFVGELTVRALLARRRSRPVPVTATRATSSGAVLDTRPAPSAARGGSRYDHLGIAELLAAIPAMTASDRAALLADERAGRRRSRVMELLEQLGA